MLVYIYICISIADDIMLNRSSFESKKGKEQRTVSGLLEEEPTKTLPEISTVISSGTSKSTLYWIIIDMRRGK